jgi:acetyltransferase
VQRRKQAGLVRIGLRSADDVLLAARGLARIARRRNLAASGVLVQEMVDGVEAFIGGLVDAQFGPVVVVGFGGPYVEAVGRPLLRLAPLTSRGARRAVDESELGEVLAPRQAAAVADALARLSWLVSDRADWIEHVDVNPLFVTRDAALAVDAFVALAPEGPAPGGRQRWSSLEPLERG